MTRLIINLLAIYGLCVAFQRFLVPHLGGWMNYRGVPQLVEVTGKVANPAPSPTATPLPTPTIATDNDYQWQPNPTLPTPSPTASPTASDAALPMPSLNPSLP